jgi:hypothetical protein
MILKVRKNRRTVQYYKPVVQYTANGQTLESKSNNPRPAKPYEIGETVDLKFLADDPNYNEINHSAFYLAKRVASNAIVFAACAAGCVWLTTMDINWLAKYGMPILFFGTLLFQAIRIFACKAQVLDYAMIKKFFSQGVFAQMGLSAILSALVYFSLKG